MDVAWVPQLTKTPGKIAQKHATKPQVVNSGHTLIRYLTRIPPNVISKARSAMSHLERITSPPETKHAQKHHIPTKTL